MLRRLFDRWLQVLGVVAVALMGSAALTGCNTTEGFGEDVEAAGEGIEDAAD